MEGKIKLTKLAKCAGCGAKVGAGTLRSLVGAVAPPRDEALLVGFDRCDDGAVYKVSDTLAIVQTVDFFPPVADDPYTFGRIAAANALSDIYAMGGEVKFALNIMAVPEDMPGDAVREILRGGSDAVSEAGAVIAGGHSIYDDEPKYGLCVTGFVDPRRILLNVGALPGDALILTKALGTGIVLAAQKASVAPAGAHDAAIASMLMLNRAARDALLPFPVHACTDVTGFGLAGHALEMAEGSGVTLELSAGAVALLPGTRELARLGVLPAGLHRNRAFAGEHVDEDGVPLDLADALYGPETSGGLLIAVPGDCADALLSALLPHCPAARIVGRAAEKGERWVKLLGE